VEDALGEHVEEITDEVMDIIKMKMKSSLKNQKKE